MSAATAQPWEPPRRVLYAFFVLLLLVLIAVLVVVGVYGTGKGGGHITRNQQILASLPRLPGATQVRVTSSPYYEGESGPIIGYTTNVVYDAPADLSAQDVVDFYVESMTPEWTYFPTEFPVVDAASGRQLGMVLVGNFARGEEGMQVNTDGIFPGEGHTYELSIDHRRGQ